MTYEAAAHVQQQRMCLCSPFDVSTVAARPHTNTQTYTYARAHTQTQTDTNRHTQIVTVIRLVE